MQLRFGPCSASWDHDPNNVENHRKGEKTKTKQDSHPSNINHPPILRSQIYEESSPTSTMANLGGALYWGRVQHDTTSLVPTTSRHPFPDGAPRQRKLWEVCSYLESCSSQLRNLQKSRGLGVIPCFFTYEMANEKGIPMYPHFQTKPYSIIFVFRCI